MSELFVDIETFSSVDIDCGLDNYKRGAELLLLQFAIDDGPAQVIDVVNGELPPAEFKDAYTDPAVVKIAHNANFEITMLNHFGFTSPIEAWQCSMARALSHALPADLATLGKVLGLPDDQQKLADGKKLIRLFCQPQPANRKVQRPTKATHPAEWSRFEKYAHGDIIALREVWRRLPKWNWRPEDIALWHLDQKINMRGFATDTELAHAGARAAEQEKAQLAERFETLTGGLRPTQRAQVQAFLNARFGLALTSTDKAAVGPLTKSANSELAEIANIIIDANKTSTAKYVAVAQRIAPDNRLRGALQFAGAGRTRRWAGRGAQFQNLPSRGLPPPQEIEDYIRMLKANAHTLLFDNLMLFGAASLRGLVVSPIGKKLVCADLSNIEGRMLAWVSGEQWKLKAFREYDAGTGPDLYNVTANMIIGVDPWKVSKKDRNVFGKVPDLACLAGSTKVLTNRGLLPIPEVLATDKVWDGVEWVTQQGVIERGVRAVVNVDGIEVTPDHLIRTGQTWTQAQQLVSSESTLCRALATGSESLPLCAFVADQPEGLNAWRCDVPAAPIPTSCCSPTFAWAAPRGALHALGAKLSRLAKRIVVTKSSALTSNTVAVCSTASQRASTGVETQTTRRTTTTEVAASGCMNRGSSTGGSSSPTYSLWMVGPIRLLNWIVSMSTEGTNRGTCDLSRGKTTGATSGLSRNCKPESLTSKRVYDLLNAGPRNRFTVKTDSGWLLVHNCGYQGGVSGFQTFAKAYGVRMADHWDTIQACIAPEHVAKARDNVQKPWAQAQITELGISELEWLASETCKIAWRARHPATVKFWYALQDAAKAAIRTPGTTITVGDHIAVGCRQHCGHLWLLIRLPSGNFITYFEPEILDDSITYWGMASEEGSTARAWVRCWTHGGKLTGNVCQTTARDLLAYNMAGIEHAGYAIVLSVHDEVITEAPDTPEYSEAGLSSLLASSPPWATGLPLASAGFEAQRYKKE